MPNREQMEQVRDATSRMTGTERIVSPLEMPKNWRGGSTRREVRMQMREVVKLLNADC